jgi:hypothetical protein
MLEASQLQQVVVAVEHGPTKPQPPQAVRACWLSAGQCFVVRCTSIVQVLHHTYRVLGGNFTSSPEMPHLSSLTGSVLLAQVATASLGCHMSAAGPVPALQEAMSGTGHAAAAVLHLCSVAFCSFSNSCHISAQLKSMMHFSWQAACQVGMCGLVGFDAVARWMPARRFTARTLPQYLLCVASLRQ